MRAISGISAQRAAATDGVRAPSGILKRWWLAYITWRMERLAVAQLCSMSDRQLEDLGLVRPDIELAVRCSSARGRIINLLGLCLGVVCLGI